MQHSAKRQEQHRQEQREQRRLDSVGCNGVGVHVCEVVLLASRVLLSIATEIASDKWALSAKPSVGSTVMCSASTHALASHRGIR